MNNILTFDDLSRLIMLKHNMMKDDADTLLNKFFAIIEKGLITDRYVRVKGLGTFKLIEDYSGNGMIYNKIVFIPDNILKESVNKPFAHFESVVLRDDVHFEDISECILPDNQDIDSNSDINKINETQTQQAVEQSENHNDLVESDEGENTVNINSDAETPPNKPLASNGMHWGTMIQVLLLGLVLGSCITWFILGNKTDTVEDDNIQIVPIIAEEKSVDVNKGSADSLVIVKENQEDSITEITENIKEEKIEFYSEKTSYKIIGTIENHIIERGSTLAKLAFKYYGNKKIWPYIVMHNKDIIKDPNNIPIGTKIRIPKLEPSE